MSFRGLQDFLDATADAKHELKGRTLDQSSRETARKIHRWLSLLRSPMAVGTLTKLLVDLKLSMGRQPSELQLASLLREVAVEALHLSQDAFWHEEFFPTVDSLCQI